MGYRAYSDGADDVAPDRGLQPAAGAAPRGVADRHGDLGRERPVAGRTCRSASASLTGEAAFPDRLETGRRPNGTLRARRARGHLRRADRRAPRLRPRRRCPASPCRRPRARTSPCAATGPRAPAAASCSATTRLRRQRRAVRLRARAADRPAAARAAGRPSSSGAPAGTGAAAGGDRRHRLRARPDEHVRRRRRRLDARLPDRDVVRRQRLHHRGRGHVLRRAPRQPPPPARRRAQRQVRPPHAALAAGASSAFIDFSELDGVRRAAEHAAVRLAGGQPRASCPRVARSTSRPPSPTPTRGSSATTGTSTATASVDRSTGEATTSFTYTRAGDFAAGGGGPRLPRRGRHGDRARSRSRATRKPVVKLPRRGRRGKATARVKCAERCTVTARIRVGGRTVRTVRRTLTTTAERRIALSLPRKVRRHRAQRAGTAHGQRALRRRAVDDRPPHGAHRALAHANSAAQVRLPTLPSTRQGPRRPVAAALERAARSARSSRRRRRRRPGPGGRSGRAAPPGPS